MSCDYDHIIRRFSAQERQLWHALGGSLPRFPAPEPNWYVPQTRQSSRDEIRRWMEENQERWKKAVAWDRERLNVKKRERDRNYRRAKRSRGMAA